MTVAFQVRPILGFFLPGPSTFPWLFNFCLDLNTCLTAGSFCHCRRGANDAGSPGGQRNGGAGAPSAAVQSHPEAAACAAAAAAAAPGAAASTAPAAQAPHSAADSKPPERKTLNVCPGRDGGLSPPPFTGKRKFPIVRNPSRPALRNAQL